MDYQDHPGLRRDQLFNCGRINVRVIRTGIGKADPGTSQHEGICRGNEGIGRHDNLITGLNIAKYGSHFQGIGAGSS